MSIQYFVYLTCYIATMTITFAVSALMLHPRTRVAFKAPVPHIHDTIGKLLIPWGITYIIFLPYIYLQINGHEMQTYLYDIICMLTDIIILSIYSWAAMSCLQQGVRQKVLQPVIILPLFAAIAAYILYHSEMLLNIFIALFVLETLLMIVYYIILFRRFAGDLKTNFSNISEKMLNGFHILWTVSIITLIIFFICTIYDTVFWNTLNILTNLTAIGVIINTSENLMPLPAAEPIAEPDEVIDIAATLKHNCEETKLFCRSDLTLNHLASTLHTKRTHLSQWFANNDTTFYSYINHLRVQYAGILLNETSIPITQIQRESGFASKTTFYKCFQEHYGCTPHEYRTNNKRERA